MRYGGCLAPHSTLRAAIIPTPRQQGVDGEEAKTATPYWHRARLLDGQIRIPLAFRVWQKGSASKYDLALELLSYARNRLKCKLHFVLFDSWYPSKKLLKRIRDYGRYFVCQLEKIVSSTAERYGATGSSLIGMRWGH